MHVKIYNAMRVCRDIIKIFVITLIKLFLNIVFPLINESEDNEENIEIEDDETEERFDIENTNYGENFILVNQRVDYQFRAKELEDICLYEFVKRFRKNRICEIDEIYFENDDVNRKDPYKKRGRQIQPRFQFLQRHPQALSHIIIERTTEIIPVLLGPQIPRRGRESTRARYCRAILTLFNPWRCVANLCFHNENWESAFVRHEEFLNQPCIKDIIDNIELLHECKEQRNDHLTQVIEQLTSENFEPPVNMTIDSENEDDDTGENFDSLDFNESFVSSVESKNRLYKDTALNAIIKSQRFETRMNLSFR